MHSVSRYLEINHLLCAQFPLGAEEAPEKYEYENDCITLKLRNPTSHHVSQVKEASQQSLTLEIGGRVQPLKAGYQGRIPESKAWAMPEKVYQ